MSEFWKAYQRPEWQRCRLETMERAGWRCEACHEESEQLHVHHAYYEKGRKPWEYPDDALICLCHECHRLDHKHLAIIKRELGVLSRDIGPGAMEPVLWLIRAFRAKNLLDEEVAADGWGAIRCLSRMFGPADDYLEETDKNLIGLFSGDEPVTGRDIMEFLKEKRG